MEKLKLIAATIAGVMTLGLTGVSVTSAAADNRPSYCPTDHDHRAHSPNYYNYYARDRYYQNDRSGVSFTLRIGDNRNSYNRNANYDRRGYRNSSNVVKRRSIDTRFRARIIVEEKIVYGRRSDRLVCTVSVRGREAGYVTNRQLRRAANRNCSRRAIVRYNA